MNADHVAGRPAGTVSAHGPGGYVSTACQHGLHDECGCRQRERSDTTPPHCKYCPASCACPAPDCTHIAAGRTSVQARATGPGRRAVIR